VATAAEQLLIRIDATTEQLRRELRTAETSTQSFQRKSQVSLRNIERSFTRLNSVVRQSMGFFGGLAGVLSVQGIVNFGRNALATADEIGKMSDQVGITTTQLQRLRFAADQTGVSASTLDRSLQQFNRRLGEAQTGTGALAAEAERLGIDLGDNQLAFQRFADAIASAESPMEQARLAQVAFGMSGQEMIRMMRGGSAAIAQFGDAAESFGLVLSEENIRKAERLNDHFSTLRQIIRTAAQESILGSVDDDLANLTVKLGHFFGDLSKVMAFFEQNSDALGMGLIGRILFGRRGQLIGLALGAISRDVINFTRSIGFAGTPVQQAQAELARVENLIAKERERIADLKALVEGMDSFGRAEFMPDIAQRESDLAALIDRLPELRQNLVDAGGDLAEFDRLVQQGDEQGGVFSDALARMGQNMIRFGNAVELPARQLPFVAQAIDDVTATAPDIDALRQRFDRLAASLRPQDSPVQQYARDVQTLAEAVAFAGVEAEELAELLALLKARLSETAETASPFSEAWEGAISQIDGAFQTFLTSGLRDFKSFGDSLMQIAQQVAAQIVSTFVRAQLQSAMATQASGGATQAVGAVGQAAQGAASGGLFGLSAGATAGLAVGASLLIGALQRRAQRRREEREQLRSLEAREREIESLIRTVGSLDDLTEQRARELEKIRPANRELQERIFRLEDELRVARERQNLEERAFRLMGNNVALREIELRQTEVANRGLLRFIFALEDAAERVARAEDNVRQALAGVERAVQAENDRLRDLQTQIRERQREAETELLERIRLIDGALSTMRQRRAALDPMTEMARARSTLAIAQAGGVMSVGVDELEEALRIVSDPSEELYASFEDYQRDFLRTKRVIEDIERQAQTQHSETLSEFEQQLEALQSQIDQNDQILEEQRRAVNALFGIDDSVRSVEDAVNNLQGAMREFSAASRAQAGLIAGGIPRPPAAPGAPAAPAGPGLAELQAKGRVAAQIAMASGSLEASGLTAADLLRVGVSPRVTLAEVERMREQVRALGGIPAFADGGMHIGGARIVGERGPELEMTGPSRIMSNDDLMSALRGDRSSAEIQAVRAEIAGLRSDLRQTQAQIVRHTKRTRDVLEGWDVEGLPEERVQA
jgi:hypothetical protein